jgi:3-isopropylmalate dehydrogenase
MLPSASLAGIPSGRAFGLYEPIHGSAPDIAGMNIANPIATILCIAMMLKYSFGLPSEAMAVERAVLQTLDEGYRTKDIMTDGMKQVGTTDMGKIISERIKG